MKGSLANRRLRGGTLLALATLAWLGDKAMAEPLPTQATSDSGAPSAANDRPLSPMPVAPAPDVHASRFRMASRSPLGTARVVKPAFEIECRGEQARVQLVSGKFVALGPDSPKGEWVWMRFGRDRWAPEQWLYDS